jgi:hypothetical protein
VSADEIELRNEFTAVILRRVEHGRGHRLAVISCPTGASALLDATVLEALAHLKPEQLASIVSLALTSDEDTDGG